MDILDVIRFHLGELEKYNAKRAQARVEALADYDRIISYDPNPVDGEYLVRDDETGERLFVGDEAGFEAFLDGGNFIFVDNVDGDVDPFLGRLPGLPGELQDAILEWVEAHEDEARELLRSA